MASPGFETRRVAVSKWLDFLDRFVLAGQSTISHPADIGIRDGIQPIDIQLLIALKEKFDLPYIGPCDDAYIASWASARMYGDPLVKSLWLAFTWRNVSSREAWHRFAKFVLNGARGAGTSEVA